MCKYIACVSLAISFIHSFYFCSASSSPLLLTSAPDTARMDTVSEFDAEEPQATASEGLAQGPRVAARVGSEPSTLLTNLPMSHHAPHLVIYLIVRSLLRTSYGGHITWQSNTSNEICLKMACKLSVTK